jgi:hypothetical protein
MTFSELFASAGAHGGEEIARHRIADAWASKRKVSQNWMSGDPTWLDLPSSGSVAVMPCRVLSYDPAMTWMVFDRFNAVVGEPPFASPDDTLGFFLDGEVPRSASLTSLILLTILHGAEDEKPGGGRGFRRYRNLSCPSVLLGTSPPSRHSRHPRIHDTKTFHPERRILITFHPNGMLITLA